MKLLAALMAIPLLLGFGDSAQKDDRRACLCLDKLTYSRQCCEGLLIQQGIGKIQSAITHQGQFSSGFSNGFDITIIQ